VEILAECPLHLGLDAEAAQGWVRDRMVPVFPLGVKKDLGSGTAWPEWKPPRFDPAGLRELLAPCAAGPPRSAAAAFPRDRFGPEIAIKLAGSGGDGIQTAAMLLTRAAIDQGFDAVHIPSYGPESRGGTSHADLRLAESDVAGGTVAHPNVLVAWNAPSLARFGPAVAPGGLVVYDSSACAGDGVGAGVRAIGVPCTAIAGSLGTTRLKNLVGLGALQEAARLLPDDGVLAAIGRTLGGGEESFARNERAFRAGQAAVRGEAAP
jgi:2-oxoisovalerate ferredoxin oxidoreductase beta subunit